MGKQNFLFNEMTNIFTQLTNSFNERKKRKAPPQYKTENFNKKSLCLRKGFKLKQINTK